MDNLTSHTPAWVVVYTHTYPDGTIHTYRTTFKSESAAHAKAKAADNQVGVAGQTITASVTPKPRVS